MDIFKITKSEIRRRILRLYFSDPEKKYYIRELARMLETSAGNVRREFLGLEKIGLFNKAKEGNLVYYFLNKKYSLYKELKSIIFKTIGIEGALKEALTKIGGIKSAFIFGSFAKGKEVAISDIDLFIIGIPDEDKLIKKINDLEKKLNREISYHIYSEKDLEKKIKEKDSFIKRVITGPKIILAGKENELPRFD